MIAKKAAFLNETIKDFAGVMIRLEEEHRSGRSGKRTGMLPIPLERLYAIEEKPCRADRQEVEAIIEFIGVTLKEWKAEMAGLVGPLGGTEDRNGRGEYGSYTATGQCAT